MGTQNMTKILRINGYIQRGYGKIMLNGHIVNAVALDGSCSFNHHELEEVQLTQEQLDDLFNQTFDFNKE